jgi:aspartyl-tRNA(Asn)/glutamyl-tRNA(Gln) amidotransferase subunit A
VKPTYGRVSRSGLVAFGSSLDQVGVIARSVDDAALALGAISGRDAADATSVDRDVPSLSQPRDSLHGRVIGLPIEYFPEQLDPAIRLCCQRAIAALRDAGATIREVSLPSTDLALPAYYVIAPAEAASNLSRFDGIRFGRRAPADDVATLYAATRTNGFGPEVKRRILLGTFVLSAGYYDAYYARAQQVRRLVRAEFDSVFSAGVDLLFTPTAPSVAYPIGSISSPLEMYLGDIFTVPASLAGIPAMSLPIGRARGLPAGGQLMARHFDETTMLAAAAALEDLLGPEAHS